MKGASLFIELNIDDDIIRAPSVTVIAKEVETGEIVWSGSARILLRTVADYSHKTSMWDVVPLYRIAEKTDAQTLSALACHALGMAFGVIAPGRYRAPLDELCE